MTTRTRKRRSSRKSGTSGPTDAPPRAVDEARPVPKGYATRTRPLSAGPGARVVGGSRIGPSATEVTRRFYELTNAPDAVRTPSDAAVKAREEQRLAAILEARARTRAAPVRSDYFGTAEHRAVAEYLAAILAGREPPFKRRPTDEPSHVLLRSDPGPDGAAGGAFVPLERGIVASAGAEWREPLQAEIAEAMKVYDPAQRLEVRPGIALTYGEIGALAGDYYETPDSLANELTPGVADAISGITPEHDGTFVLDAHRPLKYLALAARNEDHFAPRSWVRYAVHHREALVLALRSRDLEAALVRNAFADHFLEDAFATGHLRTPRKVLKGLIARAVEIGEALKMHAEENEHGLWLQNGRGLVWRGYGDGRIAVNMVHATLVGHALATSIQRVHAAYRARGASAEALLARLEAPWTPPDLAAGTPADPAEVLPAWLGELSATDAQERPVMLRDVRQLVPAPLPSSPAPIPGELSNYPPRYAPDGKGRRGACDFAAYFDLERDRGERS